MNEITESKQYRGIAEAMHALEIILTSPLWPKRDDLDVFGQNLYDYMTDNAKKLAKMVAHKEDLKQILEVVDPMAKLCGEFIENNKIIGNDPNEKMIKVYIHYIDHSVPEFKNLINYA